jgi:4,5-dihydroxyphthalate decarboxylase
MSGDAGVQEYRERFDDPRMSSEHTPAARPSYVMQDGTARVALTMALSPSDQVRDLMDGTVRAEGIVLTPLQLAVEEIFYRFTQHLEWDVSEMSFAKYISLTASGDAPMVALPVFTSRVFRHTAIYVRADAGIASPKELEGRTVGVPEWAQTAGVYVRGMLARHYGVDLASIAWVQAGVNQAGRHEKVALTLPRGIRCEPRGDATLNGLLTTGGIDAAISARPPQAFLDGDPRVRRLFPEARTEELAYYRASGVFPIMHVVAIRRDTLEQNRWIAMSLYKAFDEARRRSVERLLDVTASAVPLPWGAAIAAEIRELFGGDLWSYGVEASLRTLESFCRFAHEQGVTSRRVAVDELFPRETRRSFRV